MENLSYSKQRVDSNRTHKSAVRTGAGRHATEWVDIIEISMTDILGRKIEIPLSYQFQKVTNRLKITLHQKIEGQYLLILKTNTGNKTYLIHSN